MSIVQFTEPDINLFFDDLDQAVILNNKASFVGKGYFSAMLSNINTMQSPVLLAGSAFEANGVLFFANSDTAVTGSLANGAVNYIYATPAGLLQYGSATPSWNNVKGGWYNGNNRALAKFYYSSSGPAYGGKVLLDSYNAMQLMNQSYSASSGGNLVITGVVNQVLAATLPAGFYRFEMQAGAGGAGGFSNVAPGGPGAYGESKTGMFIIPRMKVIHYALGADGNNGGDAAWTNGGGGGCTGGSAFIDIEEELFLCIGGSGGGGCGGGNDDKAGGGGGGGGYGIGANANEPDTGGRGGNNGSGGSGGYGHGTSGGGGGGSGGYGGGPGGGSSYGSGGGGGGNYGGSGGKGGNGSGGSGGSGGSSAVGEGAEQVINKYNRRIQYQGGGGGGNSNNAGGGGGGGLKSTTSGYLRIYRLG